MLYWTFLFMKHILHSFVHSKTAERACSLHHALLWTLVISWNPLLQHPDHHGLWLAGTCGTIPGVILVENHPSCWTHRVNKTNMVFSSWKTHFFHFRVEGTKALGKALSASPSFKSSAIKKNTFESVLMRWMKLEPIIQSEVSQKEKHQYSILTHIYGI